MRPVTETGIAINLPVAPDLADAVGAWRHWLADERRSSEHTVAAYERDLVAFLRSLTGGDVEELVADAIAAPIGDPGR